MKSTLAAVAVALLVVTTGAAAAMPGNAPDDAQADEHANERADDTSEQADDSADGAGEVNDSEARDDAGGMNESEGPPEDVPAAPANASDSGESTVGGPPADLSQVVPDFVPEIHELVGGTAGEIPGSELGEKIVALVPGGPDGGNAPARTG